MDSQLKCSRCKGKGGYYAKLRNLGTRGIETHYVPCDMPGCHNGVMDRRENYIAQVGEDWAKQHEKID